MATQSRDPVILLTRPADQSERFAAVLNERFPKVRIVISPVIAPVFRNPMIPDRNWSALILTSETAALSAQRIVADGRSLPTDAFCVGDHTAEIARKLGFTPVSAQGNAESLLSLIKRNPPSGPLLYLSARDTKIDLAETLNSAGIETFSCIGYAQDPLPVSAKAAELLAGSAPVIAPVFSARSGKLLLQEYKRLGATAPLVTIAISKDAAAFATADAIVARSPDASSMVEAIGEYLSAQSQP